MGEKIQNNIIYFAIMLNLLFFVLFSYFGIFYSYSYWFDELYSVIASKMQLREMLYFIFHDVHPPLYQFLLYFWINLFGESEISTRLLSLIFASGSIVVFFYCTRNLHYKPQLYSMLFFSANTMLFYYAQEVRPYALMLFLSTLVFYLFLNRKTNLLFVTLTALGLTHFFGLLLSSAILFWIFCENIKNHYTIIKVLIVSLIILAWPFSQLIFGDISTKTGGSFWIESDGPFSTIKNVVNAIVPVISPTYFWIKNLISYFNKYIAAILVIIVITIAVYVKKIYIKTIYFSENILKSLYLFFFIIVIVLLIDTHTPISTSRNFIVIIPMFSYVLGYTVDYFSTTRKTDMAACLILAMYTILASQVTFSQVKAKATPLENWAETAKIAIEVHNKTGAEILYLERDMDDKTWQKMANNYYLQMLSPNHPLAEPVTLGEITMINNEKIILFGHIIGCRSLIKVTDKIFTSKKRYKLLMPKQSLNCSTGIIFIK